jgi:hypothetical protein
MEQPFQVLPMLLEQPGEVVLREEIRKRLWPNDTTVEFASSINAAIQIEGCSRRFRGCAAPCGDGSPPEHRFIGELIAEEQLAVPSNGESIAVHKQLDRPGRSPTIACTKN